MYSNWGLRLSIFLLYLVFMGFASLFTAAFGQDTLPTPTQEFSVCSVLASSLNVRSLPSLEGRIVGSLPRGAFVHPIGEQGDWWLIARNAWVSKPLVNCQLGLATPTPNRSQSPLPVLTSTNTPTSTKTPTNTPSAVSSPTRTTIPIFATATRNGCTLPPCINNTQLAGTNAALASGTPWRSEFSDTATALAASPTPIATCTVTASLGLNIRALPSLQGNVLTRVPIGTSVRRISSEAIRADTFTWWRVQAGNQSGWAAMAYLGC